MKFLLIGDVISNAGLRACCSLVPSLKAGYGLDLVTANVENLAGGFGVNAKVLGELREAGVNVFTSGNHIWDQREVEACWEAFPTLLRPCNYPPAVPGRGEALFTAPDGTPVGVVNVMGRAFMPVQVDDPFPAAKAAVSRLKALGAKAVIVDMHAEATSEKVALWRHLDGEVSVVVGTHTHVPTADARISARGTAYLSDLGMTGGYGGVIGMRSDSALRKHLLALPARFSPEENEVEFWALLVEIDGQGRAVSAEQISSRLK